MCALTPLTERKNSVHCASKTRSSFRGWRGWHARLIATLLSILHTYYKHNLQLWMPSVWLKLKSVHRCKSGDRAEDEKRKNEISVLHSDLKFKATVYHIGTLITL